MIPGVKIIDDILKGLPENARLRSQLTELRAQIEMLQSQLKDAQMEVENLKKQQQPHSGIDAQAAQLLVAIANAPDGATKDELLARFGLSTAKGGYHFDQLIQHGMIVQTRANMMTGAWFGATPKGREYLARKDML